MRWLAAILSVGFILSGEPTFAQAPIDYTQQSRLALAAFRCEKFAEYASLNEKTGDADRLFLIGFNAARVVFRARHSGIPMEPQSSPTSTVIQWIRLGPTADYDVGAMHELVGGMAMDEIDERSPVGSNEPTAAAMLSKKPIAAQLYRESSCEFIRE